MRGRGTISVRRMLVVVALLAATMALASGSQTVSSSCHLCHNRKRVASRLFLGFPVSRHEIMDTNFPAEVHHQHIWSSYSRSYDYGLFGSGVACSWQTYIDGSRAPDIPP